ncbi:MAG: putative Ig domain-containing protein, partial [Candidatus Eiseniibacteriota bacterium]
SEGITVTVNEVNVAPLLATIGNKAGTVGVPVTFTATATDDDIPANTLTFSLDAGAPAGATIGGSSGAFSWTPSAAGTFDATVRVTDNGTPSLNDFEAITITVNEGAVNHAPVLAAIGDKTVDELSTLAFTATATDPDAGDVLTFALNAGSPEGASITAEGAFSWTPTEAQGPGSYPATIHVSDNGTPNLIDSEDITITVNEVNVAPVLAAIGDKSGTTGVAIAFTAHATDADIPSNTLAFSLDAGAPTGATITTGGDFSWTPTSAGTFGATVRVTDNGVPARDDFEAITFTVTEQVVNHPPVLDAIGNKTVDELTALTFTATATDPDAGQSLTFALVFGAPAGAAITTGGAFSWTPTEAQGPGSYPVTVTVTDDNAPQALNDFEEFTITVNEVNVAPVLAAIGNKSGATGVAITFTASATDADIPSNTLTFSLDAGAPAGATINSSTGAFSWTPTAGGTFGATVRVTDNGVPALDAFEAITFTVTEPVVNQPPVLAAIGNRTVNELTALTFTATATDPDAGQTRTFSLDAGSPAGATINATSGAFNWTPSEAQGPGSYPITVRVKDNGSPVLDDFETITVTVNEVNVAPVLAAIANKSGTVGVAITFTATATDADIPANSLAFALVPGAPAGATINAASGAFSWTPTATGTFPISVKVTDNGTPALSDTKSFTITVTAQQQVVAAHAFFFGLNLLTILESRDPFTCVEIEPVRNSFDIKKVDLNSITMTYKTLSITASSQIDGDKNRDGDREIQACFSKPDLRRLFATLPRGLNKVQVDIQGNLPNGVKFKDRVDHFVLVLGIDCLAIRVSPNPLNPETVLSFTTSKAGPVAIQIFDVQGRLVKSLYNGTMGAGLNQVRWDGSTKTGNRASSGVYFIRTKTVDGEAVERVTVLK